MQDTPDDLPTARPIHGSPSTASPSQQTADLNGAPPPSSEASLSADRVSGRIPSGEVPVARPCAPCFPELSSTRPAAAAVDLGIVAIAIAAFQFLFVSSDLPFLLARHFPRFGVLATNVILGAFTLALIAAVLICRGQSPPAIGLNRPSRRRVLLAAVIAFPACYVASLTGFLIYAALLGFDAQTVVAEKSELFEIVADFPVGWVLPFAIFVGIHEEILFRGFFLGRLRTLSRSNAIAVVGTGIVFGLLHYYQGLLGVFQTAAIGTALAIVVTYARTLWPAIIAHAAFDATNILAIPWLQEVMQELMDELEMAPAAWTLLTQCAGVFQGPAWGI